MYTSPIDVVYGEMQMQVEGEIYKAVQKVGVNVDKEELLDALQYDRGQYEKGFADGYAKAIDDFADRCKQNLLCQTFGLRPMDIDKIAEQLKGEVSKWVD